MPVSIRSLQGPKLTVLPTTTGTGICSHSFSNRRPSRLRELWRAVVTVDWTTNTSTPASTATGANRLAFAGVQETAHRAPSRLISPHPLPDELEAHRLRVDPSGGAR